MMVMDERIVTIFNSNMIVFFKLNKENIYSMKKGTPCTTQELRQYADELMKNE